MWQSMGKHVDFQDDDERLEFYEMVGKDVIEPKLRAAWVTFGKTASCPFNDKPSLTQAAKVWKHLERGELAAVARMKTGDWTAERLIWSLHICDALSLAGAKLTTGAINRLRLSGATQPAVLQVVFKVIEDLAHTVDEQAAVENSSRAIVEALLGESEATKRESEAAAESAGLTYQSAVRSTLSSEFSHAVKYEHRFRELESKVESIRAGRQRSPRRAAGGGPSEADKDKECPYFKLGKCRHGDKCKWKHV